MQDDTSIRFVDILTTTSAVTNFHGAPETTASHIIAAIAILRGTTSLEDLGRPTSPLVGAHRGPATVAPAVASLVQRWFAELGGHGDVTIDGEALDRFLAELAALDASGRPS